MKVLITGAGGMVGRLLAEHCRALGDEVESFDHAGLDIADERAVREVFARVRPDAALNCAAWTDVDGCELDPQRAFLVNSQGVEALATAARINGASFVTVSTDYVFDGRREHHFYTQRDDPHPLSAYGAAKLEGERRAQAASARTSVARAAARPCAPSRTPTARRPTRPTSPRACASWPSWTCPASTTSSTPGRAPATRA